MEIREHYTFASESVSEGHPDKVCDRISDAVLDAFLTADPEARVACETFATTDRVVVGGEVRGPGGRAGAGRGHRPRLRPRHRLRAEGLPLGDAARPQLHPRAVRAHRPGRRRRRGQGRGRGRPGHHVRLRGRRDPGADAGADPLRPCDPAPARRGAQVRRRSRGSGPDAKSQLSLRYAGGKPVEVSSLVLSTQHLDEDDDQRRRPRDGRALHPRGPARGLADREHRLARQPDRQLRDRRAGRRRRPDRAQDHRRHLRRRGAARRRRLLGQGPDQGRPLGRLCRALPGEERGGGGARAALRDPALLRDRRGAAAVDLCRHLRDRHRGAGGDREGAGAR